MSAKMQDVPKQGLVNPCSPGELKEGKPIPAGISGASPSASDVNKVSGMSHIPSDINKLGLSQFPSDSNKKGVSHSSSDFKKGGLSHFPSDVKKRGLSSSSSDIKKGGNEKPEKKKAKQKSVSGKNVISKAVINLTENLVKLKNSKTVKSTQIESEKIVSLSDNFVDTYMPSTDREKCILNSSLSPSSPLALPQGDPLALPNLPDIDRLADALSVSEDLRQNEDIIGEDTILLVSSKGSAVQLVLNSVLSYTKKGLNEYIKSKQLTDLLISFFEKQQLNSSWNLARSLLKKKDRPLRGQPNNLSCMTQKTVVIAKQIVKMTKQIICDDKIILASVDLLFPVQFVVPNNCEILNESTKIVSQLNKVNVDTNCVNKCQNNVDINCINMGQNNVDTNCINKCKNNVDTNCINKCKNNVAPCISVGNSSLLPDKEDQYLSYDTIMVLCQSMQDDFHPCPENNLSGLCAAKLSGNGFLGSILEPESMAPTVYKKDLTQNTSVVSSVSSNLNNPIDHLTNILSDSKIRQDAELDVIASNCCNSESAVQETNIAILTELKVISNLLLTAVKQNTDIPINEDSSLNWTHMANEWLTPVNKPKLKSRTNDFLLSHSTPIYKNTNRSLWLLKPSELKDLKEQTEPEITEMMDVVSEGISLEAKNCSHLKTKCTANCSDPHIMQTLFEVNPLQPEATIASSNQNSLQATKKAIEPLQTKKEQGEQKTKCVNPLSPTTMITPQTTTASAISELNSLIGNPAFSLPFCLPFSYTTPIIPSISAPTTTQVSMYNEVAPTYSTVTPLYSTVAPPPGFGPIPSISYPPPPPGFAPLDANILTKPGVEETTKTTSDTSICSPNSYWNLLNLNLNSCGLATQQSKAEPKVVVTPEHIPLDKVIQGVPKSRVNLKASDKTKAAEKVNAETIDEPLNLVMKVVQKSITCETVEGNENKETVTNEQINSKIDSLIKDVREKSNKKKKSKKLNKQKRKQKQNKEKPKNTDETFDSHTNNDNTDNKKANLGESDPSESETESEDLEFSDGPLILAPSPSDNFAKSQLAKNQKLPPPQRSWGPDTTTNNQIHQSSSNNNLGINANNISPPNFVYPPKSPRAYNENINSSNKPDCIKESSYRLTLENKNGEEVYEEKSVLHDGMEVFHSTAYKKKMKRIEKLKNQRENKGLIPAKSQSGTRFALTNARIDLIDEDVELYLLENFLYDNIYVRKCLLKNDKYASFIFIIYSDEEVDRKIFTGHNWPGRVKCYFAPNDKKAND